MKAGREDEGIDKASQVGQQQEQEGGDDDTLERDNITRRRRSEMKRC